DVRTVGGEAPDDRDSRPPKDEQRPLRRIAQRPRQQQFAALMRLSSEAQMFLPMRRPTCHKIINYIVKQRVIIHLVSSQRYISQPCLSASRPVRMASNFTRTLSRIESDPTGVKSISRSR